MFCLVRFFLDVNFLIEGMIFFDYGCGYGEDLKFVVEKGFEVYGWDLFYELEGDCYFVDIVNFGYVINVIENLVERWEVLF